MITPKVILLCLQDKIAARKARREAEARRLADETAARSILEEQSKSVVTKQELTAENIIIPDIPLPTESTEEKVHAYLLFIIAKIFLHSCCVINIVQECFRLVPLIIAIDLCMYFTRLYISSRYVYIRCSMYPYEGRL